MRTVCLFAVFLGLPALVFAQTPDPKGLEFFEQKIRPVLVQHCYVCHSAEAQANKKLQAKLFLDSEAGILTGGETGPAIVRGKAAESRLIKALQYDGLEMPPAGRLPAEVVADFVKWIDMGAPDPRQETKPAIAQRVINLEEGRQFWSFQPLLAITPPGVQDSSWPRLSETRSPAELQAARLGETRPRTPIDRFISAKYDEKGLQPNSPATKDKLIRRVYFDLVGLPPTPEQIQMFVEDKSPNAWEKVVDELLQSERYGERWGRHWLDVARFAESGGYEFDGFRPGAYHYRDWVIRAINNDMPYNEFVRWQIAGDKLSPDEYHGASAAGFLVAGPYPGQITAKTVERIRYDQLDDMLMTVGGSMLGLTLGCVRCHDHKFDPIPQQDYYGLAASLAKTEHGARPFDPDPAATQRALDKHRADHEPLVASLRAFADEVLPKRFETWQKNELAKQADSPRWQTFDPVDVAAERSYLKVLDSGVVAHDGSITPGSNVVQRGRRRAARAAEEYTITVQTFQKALTALRLDTFTDKSLPKRGPGLNADGSFQLAEIRVTAKPLDSKASDKPVELKLNPVFAALEDKDQPLKNAVDSKPATAWIVKTNAGKDNAAIFEIEGGLAGFTSGTELTIELKFLDLGLGRLRFALSTEPNPATWAGDIAPQHVGEIRAMLADYKDQRPAEARQPLVRWFSRFDTETAQAFNAVRDHAAREPRPPLTEVYTTIVGGQDVFLLRRGEVDNKQGKAEPSFLQVLSRGKESPSPVASGESPGVEKPSDPGTSSEDPRLRFANWLTDVDHGAGALLARVLVNRLWQHHFGEGLVGTPNDFGAQGNRPSHPELLEWLSFEFVQAGWKLKPMHKLILLSAVYQQSHEVLPENVKLDPENRFLWHYQPRRLEAEVIRDALLAVGGSLDTTMYGPSLLDNSQRRSVYLRVKRSELIPFMTMFDAPEPTQSIGERVSTTVPTQALAMMNSPLVRQQAEKLAARIKTFEPMSRETAVDKAYQIALGRGPTAAERDGMLLYIQQLAGGSSNLDVALTEFCQVLLCLNEFIYVD